MQNGRREFLEWNQQLRRGFWLLSVDLCASGGGTKNGVTSE